MNRARYFRPRRTAPTGRQVAAHRRLLGDPPPQPGCRWCGRPDALARAAKGSAPCCIEAEDVDPGDAEAVAAFRQRWGRA